VFQPGGGLFDTVPVRLAAEQCNEHPTSSVHCCSDAAGFRHAPSESLLRRLPPGGGKRRGTRRSGLRTPRDVYIRLTAARIRNTPTVMRTCFARPLAPYVGEPRLPHGRVWCVMVQRRAEARRVGTHALPPRTVRRPSGCGTFAPGFGLSRHLLARGQRLILHRELPRERLLWPLALRCGQEALHGAQLRRGF
jgi:hypothetical protein